jgi:hypothetical protein
MKNHKLNPWLIGVISLFCVVSAQASQPLQIGTCKVTNENDPGGIYGYFFKWVLEVEGPNDKHPDKKRVSVYNLVKNVFGTGPFLYTKETANGRELSEEGGMYLVGESTWSEDNKVTSISFIGTAINLMTGISAPGNFRFSMEDSRRDIKRLEQRLILTYTPITPAQPSSTPRIYNLTCHTVNIENVPQQ